MKLEILAAAYNGEKFIKQQLESVLTQTYENWHMTICDDCSTDGTKTLLDEYAKKYADKISIVYNTKNLGVKKTFFKLLSVTDADHIMFCDQDDIWNSDKIQKTLDCMLENENNSPLLVHTDMSVINEAGELISPSFHQMQSIDASKNSLNRIVVQNTVTGCSMMINRELAKLIKEPSCNTLHVGCIALTASALGKIVFLPEATMQYRRNTANIRGARSMSDPKYILNRAKDKNDARFMLELGFIQSTEFAEI
ncbi:MAG: glycosyltransferase family 2 protein, partial [Firmicutes bacterium]|nr:glycosyltransferase family 2 protein [Bacillota bacterium]